MAFWKSLEAAPYKIAAVWPFTHKPSKIGDQDMLGTDGKIKINLKAAFYGLLHMDTPVLAKEQKLTFSCCVNTGCHLEDLQSAMANRDRWQERVKGISVESMPWWREMWRKWWQVYHFKNPFELGYYICTLCEEVLSCIFY